MLIYILNFISILIYSLFFKDKKKLVILITFQMMMILAFRSKMLGVDLNNYELFYATYKNYSFFEIIKSIRFIGYANLAYGTESGYVLFNWIIGTLGFDFHSYLIICAIICMSSIGIFIYRYSEEPVVSFIMFLALNGYEYFFGILRQSLGLAIFLFAIPFVERRCMGKFLVTVIAASFFHISFLFTIPLYFLSRIKVQSIHYVVVLIGSVCIAIFTPWINNLIISKVLNMLGKSYSASFEWNNMFLLLILFCILFYVLGIKQLDNVIQWGFLMALPVQALGFYIPVFSRAAIGIFLCFAYILIANIIKIQNISYKILFKALLYTAGLVFYIYNLYDSSIVPYVTFFDSFYNGG